MALVAAFALSACSSAPVEPPSAPPPPVAEVPPPPPVAEAPPPPELGEAADSCGAAELQGLIGRPRTEVPVPLDPALQRVACTTCPITQDYNPRRLNFFFDAATGRIAAIRCG